MRSPVATYRVQFNKDFRFDDAVRLVPHLHRLGISHLYASPIFAAKEGSTHGYDVVDPNRLNPALGTQQDFDELVLSLQTRGMGLLLDIVPNHMAASAENAWWMDVLESGPASRYVSFFGVECGGTRQNGDEKIFLPILGAPYGTALENGEITLSYERTGFFINYYSHKLPLAPLTYLKTLYVRRDELPAVDGLVEFFERLERLPPRIATEWEAWEAHVREKQSLKEMLWSLYQNLDFRAWLDENVRTLNGQKGRPDTFDRLHDILEQQGYRLAFWKVATERMNYRRFFDIADLIGMRVERPEVLESSHRLIFEMIGEGKVQGLRIDHIDGLVDPAGYLARLPAETVYVVVEKILTGQEQLRSEWNLHGTTGYDFLGNLNSLFVDPEGFEQLNHFYSTFTGMAASREAVERERRRHAIDTLFIGELLDLSYGLTRISETDRHSRDLSPKELSRALAAATASMPVYRTYINSLEVCERDRRYICEACSQAREENPSIDGAALDFLCRVLTLDFPPSLGEGERGEWLKFVRRWQQITGPVMAKGVEDSAFYVHMPLVSLNEVGGIPRPADVSELHQFFSERRRAWPATMNATSTHDTKRSEDVRARINVISELPGQWMNLASRWNKWLADYRRSVDLNEEYFLFQTLAGAWPLDPAEVPGFRDRMKAYAIKAAREARIHTSWLNPNDEHERDLQDFIDILFSHKRFLDSFTPVADRVAFYGAINSLSQVLVKATAPGVPDFYRGTIAWDFSLVDPDNRRPEIPVELTDFAEPAAKLLSQWRDGRVKVLLTEKALAFRRSAPELFSEGEYVPLKVAGKRSIHVFAFARRLNEDWVITVVPRLASKLAVLARPPVGIRAWHDTALVLPEDAPLRWRNVITRQKIHLRERLIPMQRALEHFPVALLAAQ